MNTMMATYSHSHSRVQVQVYGERARDVCAHKEYSNRFPYKSSSVRVVCNSSKDRYLWPLLREPASQQPHEPRALGSTAVPGSYPLLGVYPLLHTLATAAAVLVDLVAIHSKMYNVPVIGCPLLCTVM